MRLMVIGATGFIGRSLCNVLRNKGHHITTVSRNAFPPRKTNDSATHISADTTKTGTWQQQIPLHDVVINLAGKPILTRWTPKNKQDLYNSRIKTVRNISSQMVKGQLLISASATGYFGDAGDEECVEESPPGKGFLADLCKAWEKTTENVAAGVRVIRVRLGVVLGANGGALHKMLPPFKMGLGGPLGNGRQWFPWIHIDDVIGAILYLMQREEGEGVYNFVAPEPITNKAFTRALGNSVKRPAIVPVPAIGLRLLFGEAACVLMDSQKVVPAHLLAAGYEFQYPSLKHALQDIIP